MSENTIKTLSQIKLDEDLYNIVDGASKEAIAEINEKIPADASKTNKLVTENSVKNFDKLFIINVNTAEKTCDKTSDELMTAYKAGKQFIAIIDGYYPTLSQTASYYSADDIESVQLWFYNMENYDNLLITRELGVYFGNDASSETGIDIDYVVYEQRPVLTINENSPDDTGNMHLTQDDIGDGDNYKQYSTLDKQKVSDLANGIFVISITKTGMDYTTTKTNAEINAAYEAHKVLMVTLPTTSHSGGPSGNQPGELNLTLTEAEPTASGNGYYLAFSNMSNYDPNNWTSGIIVDTVTIMTTEQSPVIALDHKEIYQNLDVLEAIPEDAHYDTNWVVTEELLKTKYVTAGQAEGSTLGDFATVEGRDNVASGIAAHAEGFNTTASGDYGAHAEGLGTQATGTNAHAEGEGSEATASGAHAEGDATTASGAYSHTEGESTTVTVQGFASHAEGYYTTANSGSINDVAYPQHVSGSLNIEDSVSAVIVGNGNDDGDEPIRSNAYTLDYEGNGWFSGDVYVGSNSGTNKDDGSKKLATEPFVQDKIDDTSVEIKKYAKEYTDKEIKKLGTFTITLIKSGYNYRVPVAREILEAAYDAGKAIFAVVPTEHRTGVNSEVVLPLTECEPSPNGHYLMSFTNISDYDFDTEDQYFVEYCLRLSTDTGEGSSSVDVLSFTSKDFQGDLSKIEFIPEDASESNKIVLETTTNALSERIKNLEARGRFLSSWDATTGKPETDPDTLPYQLKAGDYYIVSVVATEESQTNKQPEAKTIEGQGGLYYTGEASTTIESRELGISDYYTFDGSAWILVKNAQKEITFANIVGDARSNTSLNNELNAVLQSAEEYTDTSVNELSNKLVTKVVEKENPDKIVLEDNTDYYCTNVSDLRLVFPNGRFHSYIRIETANEGVINIKFPAGSKIIGIVPVLLNNETWEIDIKDGVIVAGKATLLNT